MEVNREHLDEYHTTIEENISKCGCPFESIDLAKQELSMHSKLIHSFFVGKQDVVKRIYKVIKENEMPYNKIYSIDVNKACHMYASYLTGLLEFVEKVLSLEDTDKIDVNKINETMKAVKEKDEDFIDSLFDDDENPEKQMTLDEAMANVEVLIDIDQKAIVDFNALLDKIKEILTRVSNNQYSHQMMEATQIFVNSILNYDFQCVDTILDTFEKIEESLERRTPAKPEVGIPKYQLF